jgi:hypothetical protein
MMGVLAECRAAGASIVSRGDATPADCKFLAAGFAKW